MSEGKYNKIVRVPFSGLKPERALERLTSIVNSSYFGEHKLGVGEINYDVFSTQSHSLQSDNNPMLMSYFSRILQGTISLASRLPDAHLSQAKVTFRPSQQIWGSFFKPEQGVILAETNLQLNLTARIEQSKKGIYSFELSSKPFVNVLYKGKPEYKEIVKGYDSWLKEVARNATDAFGIKVKIIKNKK